VGVARRDRFGLRERKPRRGLRRRLACARLLVDPGGLDIEGQAQPRQQLATVARRRREDEAARGHPGIVHRWLARPPSPYTAAMAAPRPLDPKRLDVA